jgi:hypothetical protein
MIQKAITDTKALLALLDEEVPYDSEHPGPSLLGGATLRVLSPATTKNVLEHVNGCRNCQDNADEVLALASGVALDRNRFAQETGVLISLVATYRSARRKYN